MLGRDKGPSHTKTQDRTVQSVTADAKERLSYAIEEEGVKRRSPSRSIYSQHFV